MSLKNLRIACAANIVGPMPRIKAGYPSADGWSFKGEPKDVTSDVLKAVIEYVGPGFVAPVHVDGKVKYEIEVRKIKSAAPEDSVEEK